MPPKGEIPKRSYDRCNKATSQELHYETLSVQNLANNPVTPLKNSMLPRLYDRYENATS